MTCGTWLAHGAESGRLVRRNQIPKAHAPVQTVLNAQPFVIDLGRLRRLQFEPRLHLSEADYDDLTDGRRLCNDEGELDAMQFEVLIQKHLEDFVQVPLLPVSRYPQYGDRSCLARYSLHR